MPERESPENAREEKRDRARCHEVEHEPGRLAERLDQEPRRNVCDDDDRNDPAENETEDARENYVGIARNVEEIEVAVDQALGADDPEADRGQSEHDGIMDGDTETDRHQIKHDHARARHDLQLGQRDANDDGAENGVQDAVEPELFRRDGELAIDRQREQGIESPRPNQLRNIRDVDEEKGLEQLGDHLVGADEQDHFPFRPVADSIDLSENDAEENDLAAEPEHFHDHPENEVGLETELANERVAQHDPPDLEITPHPETMSVDPTSRNFTRRARLL